MDKHKMDFREMGRVDIGDNLRLIVSKATKGNENLGYTFAQQIYAGSQQSFLKGSTIKINDLRTLVELRNLLNLILEQDLSEWEEV